MMKIGIVTHSHDFSFWSQFLQSRGFETFFVDANDLASAISSQDMKDQILVVTETQEDPSSLNKLFQAEGCGPILFVDHFDLRPDLFKLSQELQRVREFKESRSESAPDLKKIRTLQFSTLAQEVLQWFHRRFETSSIHWFEFSSLKEFLTSPQDLLDLRLQHRLNEIECQTNSETDISFLIRWLRTLPKEYLMSPAVESFVFAGEKVLIVPVFEFDQCLGFIFVQSHQLDSFWESQFVESVREVEYLFALSLQMHQARQLSYMDDLTVLYNQRYLPELLDREISRSGRENSSFTVLFMDVDYFKKVNDTNGHLVGSRILKDIGQMIHSNIRICDSGFRYGGDEFVIVLADTNAETAEIVAERIRKKVEHTLFCPDSAKVKVTVSIGLACFPEHAKTREEIILMADQAMYDGKAKSRNIVFKAS